MRKQDDLKQELEELSPLLSKLKVQENPFKTPEGYFAALPDELIARMRTEAPVSSPPVRRSWAERLTEFLQSLLQPRIAVAFASVLVLIVAGLYWLRPENTNSEAPGQMALIADLSVEEVSDYITENIEAFEEEDLIVAVVESGVGVENTLPEMGLNAADVNDYMEKAIQEMDEEDLESLF